METTARGDVPKTLQTIAYISIPESADLEFLLWDLQDAIAAYAQLSGTALPRSVDLEADDAGVVDGMVSSRYSIASGIQRHASTPSFLLGPRTPNGHTKPPCGCAGPVVFVTCRGAVALSSVPAAVLRRFATPRVWASYAGHFPKRWISL